jgi:hypothetical protein
MTLLTLAKNQQEVLHKKTEGLKYGNLILELFTMLYLDIRTDLLKEQFNRRTAGQILNDKYATGCTDYAIVLCSFLKELNMPYSYVEVLEKRWLEAPMEERKVLGHALVKTNNLLLDPQVKIIYHNPEFGLRRYEIFGEGNEPYDLGLTDFQTNMKLYLEFKEAYKKNS